MLGFFKTKSSNFIGVDFGTSAVKIVELSLHGEMLKLENYGWVDIAKAFDEGGAEAAAKPYDMRIKELVGSLVEKMGIGGKQVYLSIPGFTGLITLVEFPEMSAEELEKAIHFESHKYIPSSVEEIAMSWEVVGKRDVQLSPSDAVLSGGGQVSNKRIQVLLVAAPKKEIAKYEELISGSHLAVNAIELETFSIARAVVGDDLGTFLIIDTGSQATNIILVEKGVVKVNRTIDAGGKEITNAISESMSISKQRAEILKKGEKDIINNKETAIVIPILDLIAGEARRILAAFAAKNKDIRIDGVILSGGSAKMKGLDVFFSNALNMKVSVANPWRRIAFDEKISPYIAEMGSSFSVAIGLALRGLDEYKRK